MAHRGNEPTPAEPRPPAWIWPWRPPRRLATGLLRCARSLGEWLGPWPVWLLAGALAGAGPLLVSPVLGWQASLLLSALLVLPLLAAAVARDAEVHGLGAVGAAFLAHSAVTIALVVHDAAALARLLPAGEAYWTQSQTWIVTGVSEEYNLDWWLPAHAQLLGGMVLFTYTSLGWLTLWQGLYEVDLMNFYVAHLLSASRSPWVALVVGWHPWSVCRGLGYLFLTFEVASWSFGRLCGAPLSTPARHRRRWLTGLALLALDGLLKYFLLEPVRQVLAANLI